MKKSEQMLNLKAMIIDQALICQPCNRYFKCRSDIYAHYSRSHYKKELLNILGQNKSCPECGMGKKKTDELTVHIGRVHGYVEQFLQKSSQVPLK